MISNINIWTWLLLFGAFFLFDVLYVLYIQAVTDVKPAKAASLGSVMYLLTAYSTIEYIDNFVNLIPIIFGGFLGSYLTLKLGKKRNGEKDSEV